MKRRQIKLPFGFQKSQGRSDDVQKRSPSSAPPTELLVQTTYTNGYLATDVFRSTEVNSDGTQASTSGSRYDYSSYYSSCLDSNGDLLIFDNFVSCADRKPCYFRMHYKYPNYWRWLANGMTQYSTKS